jgi:hypothetical protein
VALQLLSEREKHDLTQLVSTMVSYSITYKSVKSDPLPNNPRHEAVSDTSSLSFNPPINDFINFKVWVAYRKKVYNSLHVICFLIFHNSGLNIFF